MSKIYLVRHAESEANSEGLYQGQGYDTELSELGVLQAQTLKDAINNLKVNKILLSPLTRSIRTAEHSDPASKLNKAVFGDFLEVKHGLWEGNTVDTVKMRYPKMYELWRSNPSLVEFPGGESMIDVIQRVENAMKILKKNLLETNDIFVISHDNIIRIILSLIEGTSVDEMWKYKIEPAALNIVKYENGDFYLDKINENSHLNGHISDLTSHAL